jgi:O-acetyl-ADP-ribose deacetylase (regulator of RNase III)
VEIAARIRVSEGDITTLDVDAIVNAANAALFPGGGVDGAIRRRAGKELSDDLYRIGRCETGRAVITPGYRLSARHVIHTVAPIWHQQSPGQDALLAACYDNALALADRYRIASIAFPAIGTGAYGWPSQVAAKIAVGRVAEHLANCPLQDCVIFCCFTATDLAAYNNLLRSL